MSRYIQEDRKEHNGPDRGDRANKNLVRCIRGAAGGLLNLEGRAPKWGRGQVDR